MNKPNGVDVMSSFAYFSFSKETERGSMTGAVDIGMDISGPVGLVGSKSVYL